MYIYFLLLKLFEIYLFIFFFYLSFFELDRCVYNIVL